MSDTLTLLPPNATATERALARVVGRTTALAVGPKYRALWNPQTCPVGTLPWLAWSLHVDEWDSNWTEQQKRDVIAASVAVHKTKGTIGALKRALAALGYEVTVDENTGEVYTFRLEFDLNQTGILGTDTFAAARRVAMANKNARSKLLAVRSSLTANAGVYGAVAHHRAQTVTVEVSNNPTLLVAITGGGNYSEGASVTLTCVATGTGPFTYAWSFEGEPIIGAEEVEYTFPAAEGTFSCVVTDAYGRTASADAEIMTSLWMLRSDLNVTDTSGIVSSWATTDGVYSFSQSTSGIRPVIDTSDLLNGHAPIRFTNDYLISSAAVGLPIGTNPSTIACLIRCRSADGTGGDTNYSYVWGYGGAVNTTQPRALGCRRVGSTIWWDYTEGISTVDSDDSLVCLITAVYDGTTGKLYKNTALIASALSTRTTQATPFSIGTWTSVTAERVADASIWELKAWNRALSPSEIASYISAINSRYGLSLT